MIKINLLPPEILAERKRKAAQVQLIKGFCIIVVLLVVGLAGLLVATLQVNKRVMDLAAQRAVVEAEVATYAPYVELQASLNVRDGLVKKAMGKPMGWSEVLSDMGSFIPSNVWLTNFSLVSSGEEGQLTMRGVTYDHPSTARWVATLHDIPGLTNIRSVFSAVETVDGNELVRFEIRAGVITGEEFDPFARGDE
ncbi:MAG: PilN domain-containing protein [Clostridiales bacterium]|nr:PilN domain-containing protein [Clostridiales bacterium]